MPAKRLRKNYKKNKINKQHINKKERNNTKTLKKTRFNRKKGV